MFRGGIGIACVGLVLMLVSCRQDPPTPTVAPEAPPHVEDSKPTKPTESVESVEESAARLDLLPEAGDRWLRVERVTDGKAGGWATGGFEAGNRIVVEAVDVDQFVIDLSRIAIDWSRRVVLRINGVNSELTKKRYPVLRLRRSSGGSWDVVEDKTGP
jgi:hypothetical protein